ncbi:MAG: ADP-ribosylglycohydrolase family protein [Planctomycetaceae bacterium]|jgi:ADP-ribosylglycohydrolase|nr:ADP-ribosylglycohydrolase family protein [Planctomycetaceae bacterium]
MYGAIIGDICGSIYEWNNRKTNKPEEIELINPECFFTDDTVLTCAIAEAVLSFDETRKSYKDAVYEWANKYSDDKYPKVGYGEHFRCWYISANPQPYKSWGNGSAMRISAVGWKFDSLQTTLDQAVLATNFTHNHPEGIKGAQAVAAAIYMARNRQMSYGYNSHWSGDKSYSKEDIKHFIEKSFGYNLSRTLDEIRSDYEFDVSCQGSVPEAIIAFLESQDFVHAIQLAISIGGDTDTIACITGSIAEAYYREIPTKLIKFVHEKVTDEMSNLLKKFGYNLSRTDQLVFPDYYMQADKEKRIQLKIREQEYQQWRKEEKERKEREYQQWRKEEKERKEQEYQKQFQLRDVVYASVLFLDVPEYVFCRINPLAGIYVAGMYDDFPDKHAIVWDDHYSDQSRMQYLYLVHRSKGELYFSLIVSCFNDIDNGDHRDLNRIRFVEYFKDFRNWTNLQAGFVKINFTTKPEHISPQELPQDEGAIAHITHHVYGDNIDELV